MQEINVDRLKINKIGLINYWWYDEEEFNFSDGRMILRGTNGSGKSVTMQSFIPLLLDGKRSSERLDPFGNRARKIEDYVLGYGDDIKEENTSYLYMEFVKEDTSKYITVGIGLNGKKGQGVKFWGFIIKDGRRVGKDIFLYKDPSNKIPLSKLELKNRIGFGGEIVDNQKDYQKLVNDNIFGFESIDEFDEFIKLLIEIRTPKLSNGKGFRPSTVLEILTNSLRGLSDEDLRPVSESIENMNKTKEQLHFLLQSQKAVNKIKGHYEEYNKYLLYEKAKRFNEETKGFKENKNEQENLNKELKDNVEKYEYLKLQAEELDAKIKANELQEETLKNSEAWNIQVKINEIDKLLIDLEQKINEYTKKVENKEKDKRNKDIELQKINEEYKKFLNEFEELKEEMANDATEIKYDEYFFKIEDIEKEINKEFNYSGFYADLQRYIDKIKAGKNALENLKNIQKEYDESAESLEIVKNNKAKQEIEVTKNRNARDEEKTKFEDEMYKWEKENSVLKLLDEEKVKVVQKISRYGENNTFDDILQMLRNPYNRIRTKNLDEEAFLNREKKDIITKINSKKLELNEWKNKKEPEPIRSEKINENREKLKENGIDFLPFYQTIDFKNDVDEKIKGVIENSLLNMGILDALVINENDLNKFLKLNLEDKYLAPNPMEFKHDLTEFMEVSLPEDSKISKALIVNLLKTILIDDTTTGTSLDEKGFYKIGLINGFSSDENESIFIGHESKKKYREKQIAIIENELIELERELEVFNRKEQEIKDNLKKIDDELENFPSKEELEKLQAGLRESIYKLDALQNEVMEKENLLTKKYQLLKEARLIVEEKTLKLHLTLTLETYQFALETADDLKENLHELEKIQMQIVNKYNENYRLTEIVSEIEKDLDDFRYDLNKATASKNQNEEKKKSLKEIVGKEGENLVKQMDECLKLKEELPKQKDMCVSEKGKLEERITEQKNNLSKLDLKLVLSEKKMKIAEDIFKQELSLDYFSFEINESVEIMKNVIKSYNYFEKQSKDLNSYYSDVVKYLTENQEFLTDYNLNIEDLFVTTIEEDNTELINLLKTRARKDIVCFVKGRKVSFFKLVDEINETIKETQNLIDEDDRVLFEEILTNTVGRKIRESIYSAKEWVESMNNLMETIDTSSKLSFSLSWKPKLANDENEMDTRELVNILNSDTRVLKREDVTKVANHFRTKFEKATKKSKEMGGLVSFHDIMKETLDYRTWFEFQFNYIKGNETKKELTNNAFFKLSGGEKAMAMYIPLFAAVTSKFQSASDIAPRIISLDEAFAGVDDGNIRDMFRILTTLQLEYIINSQVLWGEYDTIPSLAINELISNPEEKIVSVIRYKWNGNKRELVI